MKAKILKFLKLIISPVLYLLLAIKIHSGLRLAKKYILDPEDYSSDKNIDERHQMLYKIINKLLFIKNIEVEAINLDKVPKTPVIFLANHKSNVDPLVLYKIIYENPKLPLTTFVAKKELADKKIGRLMDLIDVVFIDRKNPRQALNALESEAPLILKHQRSLTLFPEATRIPGDDLGHFNPGVTIPAYKGYVNIIPVGIYNSEGQLKDKSTPERVFQKPKSNKVIVSFGDPLKPKKFIHLNNLNCVNLVKNDVKKLYDDIKKNQHKIMVESSNDHQEIMGYLKKSFSFKKILKKLRLLK